MPWFKMPVKNEFATGFETFLLKRAKYHSLSEIYGKEAKPIFFKDEYYPYSQRRVAAVASVPPFRQ